VDGEGLSSVETEAVHREVPVESYGIVNTQTPHHRPTRAVDDGQSLTGECLSNLCGNFQVGQGGGFFGGNFSRMAAAEMGGGSGPISPGELSLTMQLQITYELR